MKAKWICLSAISAGLVLPMTSNGQLLPFEALTRDMIAGLAVNDSVLNGSDSSTNQIPTGTVLVYKTTNGYYGKLKVVRYGFNLALKVVTYNPNGSVLSQADSLIIRGTYLCDLQSATETTSGGDFFWHISTGVIHTIEMRSPAKIAVYYTPVNVVSGFTLSPSSPALLADNEHVTVHFSYATIANHGCRIWAIPLSHGVSIITAIYQGSVLRPSGSDTSSQYFTIFSGTEYVDSVYIKMADSAGTTTLFETYIPVSYSFTPNMITNIVPTPASPATLGNNDDVGFTFNYLTSSAGGARIYVRPFTKGALSPNYGAQGSPLYPAGSGTGTGSFTITTGDAVVDSARIQMWNAAQDSLLIELFVPVRYTFKSNSISKITTVPASPAALFFGDSVKVAFSYFADRKVRLFARPWINGALSAYYAAHVGSLYAAGEGADSGRAWFTILKSDSVIDSVRVQMWDSAGTTLLQTAFLAVNLRFGAGVVTRVTPTPSSPAALADNQNVNFTFHYSTINSGGVRIYIRPFTHGSLSPNYNAHGSNLFPIGNGIGTGYFTITSGNVVVDSIRVQMWNAALDTLMFELFIPVSYTFAPATGLVSPPPQTLPAEYSLTAMTNGTIRFAMPEAGNAVIRIFTGNGRCVATPLDRTMPAGYHKARWRAAKGLYIARMEVNGHGHPARLVIAK